MGASAAHAGHTATVIWHYAGAVRDWNRPDSFSVIVIPIKTCPTKRDQKDKAFSHFDYLRFEGPFYLKGRFFGPRNLPALQDQLIF